MKKNGFTLIEILAVILILGVLVTLAMTTVIPKINQSKKETFIIDAKKILKTAEDLYLEKDAMNELPTELGKNSEAVYLVGKNLSKYIDGRITRSNLYCITIGAMRNYMDINDDYEGYVFINDNGDDVVTYINLKSSDYTFYTDGKINICKNKACSYSVDKISERLVQTSKDIKIINFSQARRANIYLDDSQLSS